MFYFFNKNLIILFTWEGFQYLTYQGKLLFLPNYSTNFLQIINHSKANITRRLKTTGQVLQLQGHWLDCDFFKNNFEEKMLTKFSFLNMLYFLHRYCMPNTLLMHTILTKRWHSFFTFNPVMCQHQYCINIGISLPEGFYSPELLLAVHAAYV